MSHERSGVPGFSPAHWQPRPHLLPPSASPVPTRQPDQRFDPLPDFWAAFVPWQPPRKVLPPTASPVPTRQPDQRFDALPDFGLWQQAQARVQPPPPPPPIPTHQPDQRFDAPPDLSSGWVPWEPVPAKLTPPTASPVPTRQPDQRFDAPPDPTALWWQQARALPPAQAGPTQAPAVPFPSPADVGFSWWTPAAKLLPPTASPAPTVQPSQRFDPLPDLWAGFVPWNVPAKQTPPTFVPPPPVTLLRYTVLARLCTRDGSGDQSPNAAEGRLNTPADYSSLTLSVYDLTGGSIVPTYSAPLAPAAVITPLQRGGIFQPPNAPDGKGCNFLADVPDAAFPAENRRYRIVVKAVTSGGTVGYGVWERLVAPTAPKN